MGLQNDTTPCFETRPHQSEGIISTVLDSMRLTCTAILFLFVSLRAMEPVIVTEESIGCLQSQEEVKRKENYEQVIEAAKVEISNPTNDATIVAEKNSHIQVEKDRARTFTEWGADHAYSWTPTPIATWTGLKGVYETYSPAAQLDLKEERRLENQRAAEKKQANMVEEERKHKAMLQSLANEAIRRNTLNKKPEFKEDSELRQACESDKQGDNQD